MKHAGTAAILATASYHPERVRSTAELLEELHIPNGAPQDPRALQRQLGVRERRVAAADEPSSTLAAKAAQMLFHEAKLPRDTIDAVIFGSASHDQLEPASVHPFQASVGVSAPIAFDTSNACLSFLNAVAIGGSFIESGCAKRVLIGTGERLSPVVRTDFSDGADPTKFRSGLTLGDAGAAALMGCAHEVGGRLVASNWGTESEGWADAIIPGGGTRHPRAFDLLHFQCDPRALLERAMRLLPRTIQSTLDDAGWRCDEVDWFVPHQVSPQLFMGIAGLLSVPLARVRRTLDVFGNCAAASIPITLDALWREVGTTGMGRVLLIGGAAGFSVGVIALDFRG